MRAYWRTYWNIGGVNLYRDEQLLLLKKHIEKTFTKTYITSQGVVFWSDIL